MNKRKKFRTIESQKTKIEIQIDSNYDLKMKSKSMQRKIRMKHDF